MFPFLSAVICWLLLSSLLSPETLILMHLGLIANFQFFFQWQWSPCSFSPLFVTGKYFFLLLNFTSFGSNLIAIKGIQMYFLFSFSIKIVNCAIITCAYGRKVWSINSYVSTLPRSIVFQIADVLVSFSLGIFSVWGRIFPLKIHHVNKVWSVSLPWNNFWSVMWKSYVGKRALPVRLGLSMKTEELI